MLRSLCYYDDAEREGPLPGEAEEDWATVKAYFSRAVAALIVPPIAALVIQSNVVDVHPLEGPSRPRPKTRGSTSRKVKAKTATRKQTPAR